MEQGVKVRGLLHEAWGWRSREQGGCGEAWEE